MSYEDACKSAADAQGITAIADELTSRGIRCEVWQTGGFTMVAAVPLPRMWQVERHIGCTADGAGVINGEHGDEFESLCDTSDADANDRPRIIADAVEAWLQSHGAMTLAQWRKTAQESSDIAEALNAMGYDAEDEIAAKVECAVKYDPGYMLRMKDGTYYTVAERDEAQGTQAEVEMLLWDAYARYEVGKPTDGEGN